MIIIYRCYGGTHSSVMAASIHLELLPGDRKPAGKELLALPYFDRQNGADFGKIFYMGKDTKGHKIFIMGCKNAGYIVEQALINFCMIKGIDPDEVMFVDTVPCLNILMKVGGFISRGLHLVTLGRLFLIPGCRIAFNKIEKVVSRVKNEKASALTERNVNRIMS